MDEQSIPVLSDQEVINLEHGQLRALINSMADGVIATDRFGKIMLYNGAALNLLDSNNGIEGQYIGNILKILDGSEQPIDSTRLVSTCSTQIISRDYRIRYTDDSLINIYLSIAPVKPSYGSDDKDGFVILVRDITHEKSLEEERDEFVSVVSHELRTPVTIAEGNVSNALLAIDKGAQIETVKNTVNQARDQILFLASLINDLSTLSRAENGTLDVNFVSINVAQLMNTIGDNYRPSAEKKNLQLIIECDPKLELLYSSTLYVREILQNFITNAIKYTERGSITINASPEKGGVMFKVIDTGIGMSKSDQEQIFHKFFRSEDYRTRKSSGTGLGLYVTRKLAKLIGATISLESTIDVGSTFNIFIPSREPSKVQPVAEAVK